MFCTFCVCEPAMIKLYVRCVERWNKIMARLVLLTLFCFFILNLAPFQTAEKINNQLTERERDERCRAKRRRRRRRIRHTHMWWTSVRSSWKREKEKKKTSGWWRLLCWLIAPPTHLTWRWRMSLYSNNNNSSNNLVGAIGPESVWQCRQPISRASFHVVVVRPPSRRRS